MFAFPGDEAVRNNSVQWLLGEGVLVSPVMQENATGLNAYFPQGLWYSLFDYSRIDASSGAVGGYASVCRSSEHVPAWQSMLRSKSAGS